MSVISSVKTVRMTSDMSRSVSVMSLKLRPQVDDDEVVGVRGDARSRAACRPR